MKQSTLHIHYINLTCTLKDIRPMSIQKIGELIKLKIGISSLGNDYGTILETFADVEIYQSSNDISLKFKTPHHLNEFLEDSENQLNDFEVIKYGYVDIKGI